MYHTATPSGDITAAEQKYSAFETGQKAQDISGLNSKRSMWNGLHGNPSAALLIWMNNLLISGGGVSMYHDQFAKLPGDYTQTVQDQLSETANGMNFLSAYGEAQSDLETQYANAATTKDPDNKDLQQIQADLAVMADPTNLNFGYDDTKGHHAVIDGQSQTQITTSVTTMQNVFNQVGQPDSKWADLNTLITDSYSKDDPTNASALTSQVPQETSNINQSTRLVSQTQGLDMQFNNATQQQFLSTWQNTMKSYEAPIQSTISNSKPGAS